MNILGQAATNLPLGLKISNDEKTDEVETGVKSLEFDVAYENRLKAEEMTMPGNYLLRAAHGEKEFYTIVDSTVNLADKNVHVYAEDSGLDLINEVVGEYTAPSAMSIAAYTAIFAQDTGFEIGINEVSDQTRTLSWDGEDTAIARLQEMASEFGAEMSFSFDIDKLRVTHKYINFWKSRGMDAAGTLRIGRHIKNVRITRSVAKVATAIIPRGGIPSGSSTPITIAGMSYDDGDIYVSGRYLISRKALATWSRYLSPDEGDRSGTGHIVQTWEYDTTNQGELLSKSVEHLKKISKIEIEYDAEVVELPQNVGIGDIVKIADEEESQFIIARIIKLVTSDSEGKQHVTLDEFTTTSYPIAYLTAEYRPSGIVNVTTSLESLKANITLTAHYGGGSAIVIPSEDYRIIGTLTEGTSTITLRYKNRSTTISVPVEVDYTIDALTGVTWTNNCTYDASTGVITAQQGDHCTSKFKVQDCTYILKASTSAYSQIRLFIWDKVGNYLGYNETTSIADNAYTMTRLQLKPEYTYAVKVTNSTSFDSSAVTMNPVDNRATAVPEFTIRLADYVDSFGVTDSGNLTNGHINGELNITNIFTAAGVDINACGACINRVSQLGKIKGTSAASGAGTNSSINFKHVFAIGHVPWNGNMYLQFCVGDITTLQALKDYVTENDITLVYNY